MADTQNSEWQFRQQWWAYCIARHSGMVKQACIRPFSVTGLSGFHAGGDRVTLFLDRRLHAKSITLPADKLHQLAEMARAA